jgi:hypothetical protein
MINPEDDFGHLALVTPGDQPAVEVKIFERNVEVVRGWIRARAAAIEDSSTSIPVSELEGQIRDLGEVEKWCEALLEQAREREAAAARIKPGSQKQ